MSHANHAVVRRPLSGPDLQFDPPSSRLPQDPTGMISDGFLDALFSDHEQRQFLPERLDGFHFTTQQPSIVTYIDQPTSVTSELSSSSATDSVLPHSSTENWGSGQRPQSSDVVDYTHMLDCSSHLAEHL